MEPIDFSTANLSAHGEQIADMSVSQWHELFAQCTAPLLSMTRNEQFARTAADAIHKIKPQLPPVLNQIFELHVQLFILQLLATPSENHYGHFIGYYTQITINDVQSSIIASIESNINLADQPENSQRVKETIRLLRDTMLTKMTKDAAFYFDVYLDVWRYWMEPNVKDPGWYEEELEHLRAATALHSTSQHTYPSLLAQSWMHFFCRRDQETFELLKELSSSYQEHANELFNFLSELDSAGEWQRMYEWLVFIHPLLHSVRLQYQFVYFSFWDDVIANLPETEPEMWELLTDSHFAVTVYEDKLYHYEKWEQWMDSVLCKGRDPLDYRVADLAPIEKNAPEALLPFYHQAVEQQMIFRTRAHYKSAVKMLKRLAKLYKKTKNLPRWEQFIASFAARHSRLRALQEELRKGKLIS
ncbi:hypothetical protein EBB07_34400 [Paenibacillaceae bacterium]|nr:hypothetical protein EBB07_34400 [Paenibacillaceae bacterium]